jgi:four helix bundle protein
MKIERVDQLHVYRIGFEAAMRIHTLSKPWPPEERYALTDQIRRSSRSVCANLAEAWAKRRYPAAFISKLSDAHGEAEETMTWLRFACACAYIDAEETNALVVEYRCIIAGLVRMMRKPESWGITARNEMPTQG